MADCQVLRCPNPATGVVRLTPPDAILMEAVVCAVHHGQIGTGAPWRWEQDATGCPTAGYIVMGDDLDVGQFTVTKFIGTEEHGLVQAPDGGPGTTLVFEQLRGDGSRGELRLLVGEDVLDQLRHTFDVWLRGRPEPGDAEG
jgi:hypothetical protein